MTEIFVPTYEWNSHYASIEECVEEGKKFGDYQDGEEFEMVRLTVGAKTKYRIVNGKAVPIEVSFPSKIEG